MTDSDTIYCNDGIYLYIRRNGLYYRRVMGKGWEHFGQEHLPPYMSWELLGAHYVAAYDKELPT